MRALPPLAMTFVQRIHQVAAQDGVEAVLALRNEQQTLFAGEDAQRALAESAAGIQRVSPVPMIRVNAGTHAVFACSEEGTTVVLVFKKAHPVVKSVKRTMRQLLRKAAREAARTRRIHFSASVQPPARAAGF